MIKKAFLTALLVSVSACSSDSGNSSQSNDVKKSLEMKVKNIIQESYDDDGNTTVVIKNFSYEKDKLVGISELSEVTKIELEFTYTGDKITKANYQVGTPRSKSVTGIYEGDKLVRISNENYKTDYTYEKGVLKCIEEFHKGGDLWRLLRKERFKFDQNGNIEELLIGEVPGSRIKKKYVYDDKKNPYSNMNPYFKCFFGEMNLLNQKNNSIKEEIYNNETKMEASKTISSQIEYNSGDYPVEIKKIDDKSGKLLSKITITYI